MVPPLNIICCTMSFTKTMMTGPVQCPRCGDRHRHVRHGFYERYLPDCSRREKVQRYRCLNTNCPRVTFSILPFPCLRFKRHSLATFGKIAAQAAKNSVNRLARLYDKGWSAMRRLIRASQLLWSCLYSERRHQPWGPCPCEDPARFWTSFTQALSYATVPALGHEAKTTQIVG